MKKFLFLFFFVCITLIFAQPTNFVTRGIDGGGALFNPVINPHNTDQIFLTCDMTQQFVSDDKGGNWRILPFSELVIPAQSQIQFTTDPNILYTVGLDFRNDITYPAKSSDGGQSWTRLNTPQADGIIYLAADYNNMDRIIATDWGKIYISMDGGQTWDFKFVNSNGVYLAGIVWDNDNIYIGTNYGVLFSDDGGDNFQDFGMPGLPAGRGFTKFSGIADNGGVRLIGVMADQADIYPWVQASDYEGYRGVYKMDVGVDVSWIDISPNAPNDHKFFQIEQTSNPDIAYLSGTDASTSFPIVYKTENGGNNWESIFNTQNNQKYRNGLVRI